MKTAKLLIAGTVLTSTLLGMGATVHADEVSVTPKAITEKTIKSTGEVTFTMDDSVVPPVDPTDPDIPVDPTDPTNPGGTSGPLSIDHVSNIYFSEQLISAKAQTYYALLEEVELQDGSKKEVPLYTQVSDKRGSNEGWTLQVKQEKQFSTKEGTELKAAVLTLANTQVKTTADNKAPAPTPAASEMALVPGGGNVTVSKANVDEGMGLWTASFGNETTGATSVSLDVPGESAKQEATYSTELTWTLSNAPI